MVKNVLLVIVIILVMGISMVYANPPKNNSFTANQMSTNIGKKLELFVGMGYYNPSFRQWNEGIDNLNEDITSWGINLQSNNVGHLKGQSFYNFGVKYHFHKNFDVSLSIGHFEADANTKYFLEFYDKLDQWPNFDVHSTEDVKFIQDIRINPTLVTLSFHVPYLPMKDMLDFYIGGGLGLYFSTIKNEIHYDEFAEYSNGKNPYRDTTIVETINLLANIRTNKNPLGYHLVLGYNFRYSIFNINMEVGYNFATARIKEDDWVFFTQKESYFEQLSDDIFEKLKVTKLDFNGLLIKGNVGFAF